MRSCQLSSALNSLLLSVMKATLTPGEYVVAYLGHIYIVIQPDKAKDVYDEMANQIQRMTDRHSNQQGQHTKSWNRLGQGSCLPSQNNGLEILRSP